MNACIFCGQTLLKPLSFSFIFSFKKMNKPLVCPACLGKFDKISLDQTCVGCSYPQSGGRFCLDCQKWRQEYPDVPLKHTALFTYNEMAKEYMKEFKFQGDLVLAELFARELSEKLAGYQKTHHIVPIPISQESLKTRGFSQVNLLLETSGITYKDWLSHIGTGQRQSTKNREERLRAKQFLRVNAEVSEINKPLLIVDDVYTTGRTIMHAKNAFYQLNESIDMASFSLFR